MPDTAVNEVPVRLRWYPPLFEPGAESHRFAYEKEAPLSNDYYRRERTPSGIAAPHADGSAGHAHTKEEKKMAGDSHGHSSAGAGTVAKALGAAVVVVLLLFALKYLFAPTVIPPAPGTFGGGYVAGAPRNPAECKARGGTDLGRGCLGYR
jgi:hypothetical protein